MSRIRIKGEKPQPNYLHVDTVKGMIADTERPLRKRIADLEAALEHDRNARLSENVRAGKTIDLLEQKIAEKTAECERLSRLAIDQGIEVQRAVEQLHTLQRWQDVDGAEHPMLTMRDASLVLGALAVAILFALVVLSVL